MIDQQSYPVVLVEYHLILAISALVAWWVLSKVLKVADNRGRLAWAATVFTLIEAIALTPMTGFVRANVGIRDEALNFMITHSVAIFLLFLASCVICAGAKDGKALLYFFNVISFCCIPFAWLSN